MQQTIIPGPHGVRLNIYGKQRPIMYNRDIDKVSFDMTSQSKACQLKIVTVEITYLLAIRLVGNSRCKQSNLLRELGILNHAFEANKRVQG